MKPLFIQSAKWAALISLSAVMLSACSGGDTKAPAAAPAQTQTPAPAATPAPAPAAQITAYGTGAKAAEAYKAITDEMNKASSADAKPDYALVSKTYNEQLKALVQVRDKEASETLDQFITAAIDGAKDGKMNGMVAKQIVDKLLQKVLYSSMKATFKDVTNNWAKPEEAKKALAEAKSFYKPVLESTVSKRDNTFKTTMVDAVNAGFGQMEQAIGGQSTLPFELGKQVVDKTIMKTFYLVIAGKDLGYAYKVEKGVAEGKDPKVEQAEGWAFYQSIIKYLQGEGNSKEDAEFVNKQLDLTTDTKTVKGDAINTALVRGFARVALNEYKTSLENWGKDRAAITGLEGALFIDLISFDITRLQGEATYKSLKELAEKYNAHVKDNKKEDAAAVLKQIEPILNDTIAKAK
jgi:hypothetical protein